MALRTDPTPAIGNTLGEHSTVSADEKSENHRATVPAKGGFPCPLPMGFRFHMTYAADSNDYRELFDDAPVAYHELDEQGIIRKVNNAECQLLGFSAEEMIGRPIWEFLVGEEAAVSRIAIREKLAGKRPLAPFCRTCVTRDNRYRTVQVRDRLIQNSVGDGVGI